MTRGRYDEPVTPADLAPRFAQLFNVTLSHAQGRPLAAALR
jgi:hypothetical protein